MSRASAGFLQDGAELNQRSKKVGAANSAEGRTYKIGEAADILGLKAYVLRFWESEFPMLRPGHTASKHRVYSDEDLERPEAG